MPTTDSAKAPTRASRRLLVLMVLGALAPACATVQPWQRGRLADACMTFDANGVAAGYSAHWQESREGSAGGSGVGGGGCGCK